MEDKFSFYMPFDIKKSTGEEEDEWRIAGFASTANKDRQDDIIVQKGLDISDFVNYGFLNYDHATNKIVGYPDKEKTRLTKEGFWVEGILLKGVPESEDIWKRAVALKKAKADRKLGFSVEGRTLEKDDYGRIVKAKIYHVAVTASPVNTSCTFDALCKSFSSDLLEKTMEAGYSVNVEEATNGSSLKTEDLESAYRVLAHALGSNKDASSALEKVKKFLNKSMDSSELALYFQLTKGLTRSESFDLIQRLES